MSSRPRRSVPSAGSSAVSSTVTARLAALLALPALLVACGDDGHGGDGHGGEKKPAAVQTARDGEEFNQVDVDFATAMIPHHAQAVQMANLAEDRPLSAELRTLVESIHTTQVGEVETMVTWLTDWGQEIPETSMDHVNGGHGHPDESEDSADEGDADDSEHDAGHSDDMPGMMSAAQMDELEQSSDAEFPALWLTMMIEHHRGAIEMARTEQDEGHATDAVDLARTIADAQAEEITSMEALLEQG